MAEENTEDVSPAEEAPADESDSGPLTDQDKKRILKETFGDDYHGETEEPEEIEESEEPEFFKSVEEAAKYNIDKHRAAERIEQDLAEEVAAPAPIQTEAEPVSDAVWTNEDVASLQAYNQAAKVYQNDVQDIAEIKNQLNQSGLERTDRARAVAYQAQIRDAERELEQRHQTLSGMQAEFGEKAEKHKLAQGRNMVRAEQAKLMAAVPDYEAGRVATYLEKSGFTEVELRELSDHRMAIVADKARRWDEFTSKTKKSVRHAKRKLAPARQQAGPTVAELKAMATKTGRVEDAAAYLAAVRRPATGARR